MAELESTTNGALQLSGASEPNLEPLSQDRTWINSEQRSSSGIEMASGLRWASPSPLMNHMRIPAPVAMPAPVSYPDHGSNLGHGPAPHMTLAALAPVPQARPVPVVQPPIAFQVPSKRITNLGDIEHFQKSEAGKTFLGFIVGLSDSMVGKKLSDYCRESPVIKILCGVLEEMSSWIEQLPPKQQPARYGNPAFREWQTRLEERGPGLMLRILPENLKEGVVEIFPYFADSFGNATRIDYGTGHEANFAAWLLCLARLGLLNEDDYQALVARVFVKYLDLMRKLQTTYWLEPAGRYIIFQSITL